MCGNGNAPAYMDWFGDYRSLRFMALTSVSAFFDGKNKQNKEKNNEKESTDSAFDYHYGCKLSCVNSMWIQRS